MKDESTGFTREDVQAIVSDYFGHEKEKLVDRLKKIADDVDELTASITSQGGSPAEWSPVETLAHMVTSSQYFGWLAHQVAVKKGDSGDIFEMLKMRDAVTSQAADQPADVLSKQLRDNLERTSAFVEKVSVDDLRTKFDYVGRELTVEDLIRIPLCAHLESHIDQIRDSR